MTSLRKLAVLSSVYPTIEDPTKGLPIWATLRRFPLDLDFAVYCSLPWRPGFMRRLLPPRTYLRYPAPVDSAASRFRTVSLPFFSLPGIGRNWNGKWLARALHSRLAPQPPQALLAYRIYPDGYAAVQVGRRLGIPAVIGSRGSDLKMIPPAGPIRAHTILALQHANAVLCVSQDLVQAALQLGASPERTHLVRNGIDRQIFAMQDRQAARNSLGLDANSPLLVFVGNLLPVKNVHVLIEAAALLQHQGHTSLQLAIIGEGNLEGQLRQAAQQFGVASHVLFLGAKPASEVAQWLNAADVFCLPSQSEGLPNVVLEALSCGCPVVGTTVGGIPELVNSKCGILASPGNAAELAAAITQALKFDWNREAIAGQPISGWESVADRTLDFCRAAVAEGPRLSMIR